MVKVKFSKLSAGEYCTDGAHIFEAVRSGDIMQSFSPDTCVMRVARLYPEYPQRPQPRYEVGQVLEDYFNADFYLLGDKKDMERFCLAVEKYEADQKKGG